MGGGWREPEPARNGGIWAGARRGRRVRAWRREPGKSFGSCWPCQAAARTAAACARPPGHGAEPLARPLVPVQVGGIFVFESKQHTARILLLCSAITSEALSRISH